MSKLILINQSPSRLKEVVGYNCHTRKLIDMPFKCARKPPTEPLEEPHFCFVSNPLLVKSPNVNPFMWMHCYKKPGVISSNAPKYLYPESNFIDPIHVPISTSASLQFDYFYFTITGPKGDKYKGFDLFDQMLPHLASMNLRGLLVVYNVNRPDKVPRLSFYRGHGVTVKAGRQDRAAVASLMAACKFGLFPNKEDCSPRMIPECFLQNRPAVVNKKILGGWHYFEDKRMGSLFNPKKIASLKVAVKHALSLDRNQNEVWMEKYGFNRSCRHLAELFKEHYPCKETKGITHAYFKDFKRVFKRAPEIFTCE